MLYLFYHSHHSYHYSHHYHHRREWYSTLQAEIGSMLTTVRKLCSSSIDQLERIVPELKQAYVLLSSTNIKHLSSLWLFLPYRYTKRSETALNAKMQEASKSVPSTTSTSTKITPTSSEPSPSTGDDAMLALLSSLPSVPQDTAAFRNIERTPLDDPGMVSSQYIAV